MAPPPLTSAPSTSCSSRPAAPASSRSSTTSPTRASSRLEIQTGVIPGSVARWRCSMLSLHTDEQLVCCKYGYVSLQKLSLVNDVLFTGGSVKRAPYFETIKKVFQYVLDNNDARVPFPLFAHCLGFELVNMIDNNILESFHASDQASTLQFPNYSSLQDQYLKATNYGVTGNSLELFGLPTSV